MHCNGVADEKIRDKKKYNTIETSLCLRGRCCGGDKNQTGLNKYTPEAKAVGREVWTSNKSKQNKIHETLKNANLWEGYGNRSRKNEN